MTDAFGYQEREAHEPVGVQVGEAKHGATLMPRVMVSFRFENDGDLIGLDPDGRLHVVVEPDTADFLAEQLVTWARRAREKHFG